MITLYDADRCPYCARTRIVLVEKGVDYETVVVDLDDRPAWIYEKNPVGRVPVIEEDTFVLAESAVINEYLSVPTYYGDLNKADELSLSANPTLVSRLTGADPARVRAVVRVASSPEQLPPPRELLATIAEVMGLEARIER